MLQLGFGQRNGFDSRSDDAGRDRVVLARGLVWETDLEGAQESLDNWVVEGAELRVLPDGDGTREAVGVFVGVFVAENTRAGGMQLYGLAGSLAVVTALDNCSSDMGSGAAPGIVDE